MLKNIFANTINAQSTEINAYFSYIFDLQIKKLEVKLKKITFITVIIFQF